MTKGIEGAEGVSTSMRNSEVGLGALLGSITLDATTFESVTASKIVTNVSIGSPSSRGFFRQVGEPHGPFAVLIESEGRDVFILTKDMIVEAIGQHRVAYFHLCVTRQNVPFFVLRKLPADGKENNPWTKSLQVALEKSKSDWVRATADMSQQSYEVFVARNKLSEPVLPEGYTATSLFEIATRDKIITKRDHLILRKLRGED